ncbi:unnamed protein product [Miscanthus lutarioriparius]|uniref:Uncharacterized protein n=1 Tax=Miscanthus lutarioriparius TaxID=422564 RepID=A0A811Q7E1_9POAL|nr:unnamed protein product [Miscanthus lutarioriparius]
MCSSLYEADMRNPPVGSVFSMPLSSSLNSAAAYTSLMQNVTCKKKETEDKSNQRESSHLNADYLGSN